MLFHRTATLNHCLCKKLTNFTNFIKAETLCFLSISSSMKFPRKYPCGCTSRLAESYLSNENGPKAAFNALSYPLI